MQLEIKKSLKDHKGRIQNVGDKMGDLCRAHNDVVDSYQEHTEAIGWLKDKIAHLEDRFDVII